jgi:glyoxylase-like metal-dependent hydrolase (beta-lactamase superfamily II)
MKIVPLYPFSFGSNCYLIESNGEALIVDPSLAAASIFRRLDQDGCTPVGIILTHGHFDHIMSIDTLRQEKPDLKVYIHEADAPMLTEADKNGFTFFFQKDRVWNPADVLLREGDEVRVGDAVFTLVHTPGHSPGSSCYHCPAEGIMITGDTLFADSIGRCDLWGGNYALLKASLKRLRGFDGDTTIYPGHEGTAKLSEALDAVATLFSIPL